MEIERIDKGASMFAINLPNVLTIFRISLLPILVLAYYYPSIYSYHHASGVFVLICFSDWLDGFLARKLQQESKFGEFLDPVADKLAVSVALVLLVQGHANMMIAIPAMIIISREILISALREWMAELGKRTKVSVSYLGKVKTFAQMVAIMVLLANPPSMANIFVQFGYGLLYFSVLLTIWSMMVYLCAARVELNK